MAAEGQPVEVACRVLGVLCAGFYAWRFRPPSARAVRHAWLTDLIREVHVASYGTYGAKRVHAELVLGRGIQVGHNAIAMLMQRAGIAGRTGAPKRRGIIGAATADDLVDRIFVREGPNQLWLTDISEHPTREGKVYCAVVLDAFLDEQRARDGGRAAGRSPRRDGDPFRPRVAARLQGIVATPLADGMDGSAFVWPCLFQWWRQFRVGERGGGVAAGADRRRGSAAPVGEPLLRAAHRTPRRDVIQTRRPAVRPRRSAGGR